MDFPETAYARTGRSGGFHLLYDARELEDWPKQGNIPGGQIKSNGFIVVEPSVHPSGRRYKWGRNHTVAPIGDLGRALAEYRRQRPQRAAGNGSHASTDQLWQAVLDAEDSEQHDAILGWVWDAHARGLTDDEILDVLEFAATRGDIESFDKSDPWTRAGFAELLAPEDKRPVVVTREEREILADIRGRKTGAHIGHGKKSAVPQRKVARELERLHVKEAARREFENEGWEPPTGSRSLAEARRNPPPPVRQIVSGILPKGIAINAAQFKAGKTTLAINLADALASGEDFLGVYPVDFPEGNVGYWNMEVDESQFHDWLDARVKSEQAAKRIITAPLRGARIDFLYRPHAEWTIRWLGENSIQAWIIDPLGRMLEDENSNPEFNRWFRELERIIRVAGVPFVFIPHHSGHPAQGQEDSTPRGRGASAMLGGCVFLRGGLFPGVSVMRRG